LDMKKENIPNKSLRCTSRKNSSSSLNIDSSHLPDYNGFGGFEDSLQNCLNLVPKPAKRDEKKYLKFSRNGIESNILRFQARDSGNKAYLVSVFLEDDSVKISAIGKFNVAGTKSESHVTLLERRKMPNIALCTPKHLVYVMPCDFVIGQSIVLNGVSYEVTGADEYTLKFMETNSDHFSVYDREKAKKEFIQLVSDNSDRIEPYLKHLSTKTVEFEDLCTILRQHNEALRSEEIYLGFRLFGNVDEILQRNLKTEKMKQEIGEELAKQRFDKFDELEKSLRKLRLGKRGDADWDVKFLPIQDMIRCFKGFRIKCNYESLENLLNSYTSGQQNKQIISYEEILRDLKEISESISKGELNFSNRSRSEKKIVTVQKLLEMIGKK